MADAVAGSAPAVGPLVLIAFLGRHAAPYSEWFVGSHRKLEAFADDGAVQADPFGAFMVRCLAESNNGPKLGLRHRALRCHRKFSSSDSVRIGSLLGYIAVPERRVRMPCPRRLLITLVWPQKPPTAHGSGHDEFNAHP